jgi:hypothetical protein
MKRDFPRLPEVSQAVRTYSTSSYFAKSEETRRSFISVTKKSMKKGVFSVEFFCFLFFCFFMTPVIIHIRMPSLLFSSLVFVACLLIHSLPKQYHTISISVTAEVQHIMSYIISVQQIPSVGIGNGSESEIGSGMTVQ